MSTDVEEFLAHHGILGMKWGKRKATPYANNKKMKEARDSAAKSPREARALKDVQSFDKRGKDLINRSKGSKTVANLKIAGRTAALGVLTNVGSNLAFRAAPNSDLKALVALGTAAAHGVNMTLGLRDIVTVSIQPKK